MEAMLYALPILLPFGIWLALQGTFTDYVPTAADLCALASGLIVLSVFIIQQHFKTSSWLSRSTEFRKEIDHNWDQLADLQQEIQLLKQAIRASKVRPPAPSPSPSPARSKQENFLDSLQPPFPVAHKPHHFEEPDQTPPPPSFVVSEDGIVAILKTRFIELAGLTESNADRLATNLRAQLPDSNQNPQITIIYRDAAVEGSKVYRLQREDVQIAAPSIAVIFPSGTILLFPAPMAGQDCFHDVKAFISSTPAPSQNRSGLARFEPAQLTCCNVHSGGNETSFELSQSGKLDFRN